MKPLGWTEGQEARVVYETTLEWTEEQEAGVVYETTEWTEGQEARVVYETTGMDRRIGSKCGI